MMSSLWWILTLLLMLAGLIGTVVPFIPGALLIFLGALLYELTLGVEGNGLGIWTMIGLGLLMIGSYAVEFFAGSLGAKYYGATKWGMIGGIVGGIVGVFFGLPGLILGPIIGVLAGEIYAGQKIKAATRSTWGTVLGGMAGLFAKLFIAIAMILWFCLRAIGPL